MRKRLFIIALSLLLTFSTRTASAQTPTPASPAGPLYIVQAGDTLWDIAALFNTGINDIMLANGLPNADIYIGDRLVIPGLEGLSGTLITKIVPFGETLRSLSRQYRVDEALLKKLNHILSPTELYAGAKLIILQQDEQPAWPARSNLKPGETLLELAVRQATDAWTLAEINRLPGTWAGLPDDVLYLPSGSSDAKPTGLPAAFSSVNVTPLPLVQGITVQILTTVTEPVTLGGMLVDNPLNFFQMNGNSWVALQGVHAMLEPGIYPLRLEATLADGSSQSFEQNVLIASGYYRQETLFVELKTIDPAVTEPENAQILELVSSITAQRFWNGVFQSPAYFPDSFTSTFGKRREYKAIGSHEILLGFHTGLDFGGGTGLPITAPAPGVVVFAGPLEVRGNATLIDHGWGVFSSFWHQSEILVQVGQKVERGDIIGKVGGTGRVTGPHLHWEIWVNGIQVDPQEWLEKKFPH
ncbi:MAG: peptidoglycan DD-metalloendopeptidase family protein [Anaerolineales bacterium]|nr:peptidoglycan DD-metalloendopeptidase family protein [Anaerolineales bacterium]